MTNDKREQARKYESYAAILERDANPLTPHGIAHGLGAQLIRQRAAALLCEAEAATAPDVSEAFEWQYSSLLCRFDSEGGLQCADNGCDFKPTPMNSVSQFVVMAGIRALITALRAARKREGDAVELLRHVHEKVIQGSFDGVVAVDDFIVRFLAARKTAAGGEV